MKHLNIGQNYEFNVSSVLFLFLSCDPLLLRRVEESTNLLLVASASLLNINYY